MGRQKILLTQNSVRAGFAVNSSARIAELSAKPAPTTQNLKLSPNHAAD